MSRVFDGNTANVLTAAVGLGANRPNFTLLAWVKTTVTGSGQAHTLDNTFNNPRLQKQGSTFPLNALLGSTGSNVIDFDNRIASGAWVPLIGRTTPTESVLRAGAGTYINTSAYTSLLAANVTTLRVGSGDSLDAWSGKIAHVAAWNRALSDTELDALIAGGNPNSIDPTGRWYYYPLTDAALANIWTPGGGDTAGALTVNGTVTSDAGDNPAVSGGGPAGSPAYAYAQQ